MGIAAEQAGLSRQPLADRVNGKNILCGIAAGQAVQSAYSAQAGIRGSANGVHFGILPSRRRRRTIQRALAGQRGAVRPPGLKAPQNGADAAGSFRSSSWSLRSSQPSRMPSSPAAPPGCGSCAR